MATDNLKGTQVEVTKASTEDPYDVYHALLDNLAIGKAENVSIAVEKYKALYKGQPVTSADTGYVLFENFYQKVNDELNKVHEYDTAEYFISLVNDSEEPISKQLQEYRDLVQANGFLVDYQDGSTYLKQNRDFIARHFYPFVSSTMQKYLAQVEKENEDGFSTDGGIFITETEFVNRILWWENFVKQNPAFVMIWQSKEKQKEYLTYFLEGMDNTPVMDMADSTKVNSYFADGYKLLDKVGPTSEANRLVKPYFQALQKGGKATAYRLLEEYREKELIHTLYEEGCPY
ncbi:hypothetical protein GCM10023183_26570 [Nibribacter koreensis]|uniref:Uncharacterized protein n=2 Tax=Nibribacter koreensis TaxID=1084519 RepID=A0ABP8FRT7_9BACT